MNNFFSGNLGLAKNNKNNNKNNKNNNKNNKKQHFYRKTDSNL